jgi:AcrR family transcriptional regulator
LTLKLTLKQARRVETEQRLIDAAWQLLREQGVAAIGVNTVAERAGADKVLIYRYFGGLPGLLERCGEERDFWPTLDELLGPDRIALRAPSGRDAAREVFGRYVAGLRARPATLQLLAYEMVDRNELTLALERVREARSQELMGLLAEAGLLQTEDQAILAALFLFFYPL